jgi:hypothetical protein
MTDREIKVEKVVRQVNVGIDPSGAPSGGPGGNLVAPFNLVSTSAATVPFTITGYASQSADLQRWNNSGGTTLARVQSSGNIVTTGTITASNLPGGTIVTTSTGPTFYPLLSTLTAKGDIYVATASGTITRLPVGSNNQVLAADSTTATGLKWGASGSGYNTVQNNGTPLTARAAINFINATSIADDSVNGRTNVTLPTGGGGGTSYYGWLWSATETRT